jgi:hypothetical protein
MSRNLTDNIALFSAVRLTRVRIATYDSGDTSRPPETQFRAWNHY